MSAIEKRGGISHKMNQKKSSANETYYDDQMKAIWIEYGHPRDIEESPVGEREVK